MKSTVYETQYLAPSPLVYQTCTSEREPHTVVLTTAFVVAPARVLSGPAASVRAALLPRAGAPAVLASGPAMSVL
jgi:hypothetical protein